jgi:Spy/CpxP family protein refolding chaperone
MKNKTLLFAILSFFTLACPRLTGAQTVSDSAARPKPTEVPSPAHLTRKEVMDKLQVTKDQRLLLRQNRATYRHKIAVIEGQFKVKKVELENEIEKPDPDLDKIDQLTSEIGTLLGQKYSTQIKAELEVEKKILTPDQAEQLKTLQGREVFVPNDIF